MIGSTAADFLVCTYSTYMKTNNRRSDARYSISYDEMEREKMNGKR